MIEIYKLLLHRNEWNKNSMYFSHDSKQY
jgi:hypothetical protein